MSVRIPEVPPSFGVTMAAVAGLAFVFAHAGRAVVGAKAARAAADEVRRKAQLLAGAVGRFEAIKAEVRTSSSESVPADLGPGGASIEAEAMLDLTYRSREVFRDSARAARELDQALADTRPFAAILERLMPGWKEHAGRLHASLQPLLLDLERTAREALESEGMADIDASARALLFRSLADQGFTEWASSLPSEEEPLVDEDDGEPIRWDGEHGWQPGQA